MDGKHFRISKDVVFITVLIFVSLLFLLPVLHPGFYLTQDAQGHIARFAAYYKAFVDGQFPPRWAGFFNYGYGTPVLLFYYPLPGYLASFLHLFGLHYEIIYKIVISSAFMLAPFSFYIWVCQLFKKEVAFVGALLYCLAPYHLLDLYVRSDIAELLAFVFVPCVLFTIEKIIKQKNTSKYVLSGAIWYALLVLSHNGVSLMFSPFFFLYALIRARKIKSVPTIVMVFIVGLFLSAFFWLPALYEARYTNTLFYIGSMYKEHFPSILQLIYSPWGFGTYVQKPGGLSPQIGPLLLVLVCASLFAAVMNKQKRELWFWFLVFIVAVFISLPYSAFIWKRVPLLRLFEFPWRFTALSSFAAVVLSCYGLSRLPKSKFVYFIAGLICLTSLQYVKVQGYSVGSADFFYEHFKGTTSYHGEGSPIWVAGDASIFPQQPVSVISGRGMITELKRKSQIHTFIVSAKSEVMILDNTLYFPGWRVFVDGEQVVMQFQDPNHRGLITFQVPKGRHWVKVIFTETFDRIFADTLTIIGLVIVFSFFSANLLQKDARTIALFRD